MLSLKFNHRVKARLLEEICVKDLFVPVQATAPITLDERGLVVIHDNELLDIISGGAVGGPAPAPAPPPSTNYVCPSGNSFCPGAGSNVVCPPTPRPPIQKD